jgi:23S rRNA pseudouridine1911/1915/1917 synthase
MKTSAKVAPKEILVKEFAGERLDRFLQEALKISRKKAKVLLDQGRIFINGRKVVIASWEMKAKDRVTVQDVTTEASADRYYLKVVHEDDDLIVVEKEPGIACEKSLLATRPTMVAIINAYFKRRMPHLKHHYLGLVHRLDQDTSGLMIYTKTKAANKIADQFKRHTIKRKYMAVVQGRIEADGGKIEGYLQKSDLLTGGKKVKLSTKEAGRPAMTIFQVKERYPNATLVEIQLDTGRTHQIRVHMASIGHGVVGDKIYGDKKSSFPRQALHASVLGFHHPVTQQKVEFISELPRDLRKLVDRLRLRS